MNNGRVSSPGKTRTCPHCKATILESVAVCPGCNHHLRFDPGQRIEPSLTPLKVQGAIRHPATGGPWEYSMVLSVRNGRGEEITRQVVGVGALQPAEERTFTLAVEVFTAQEIKESRPQPVAREAPVPAKEPAVARPPGAGLAPPSRAPTQPRPQPPQQRLTPAPGQPKPGAGPTLFAGGGAPDPRDPRSSKGSR